MVEMKCRQKVVKPKTGNVDQNQETQNRKTKTGRKKGKEGGNRRGEEGRGKGDG